MKKFVDDIRLVYKCCSLYYEDEMRQQEIAEYLSISRASVSRMLQLGKELGIVKIEICNPGLLTYGDMERELERRLGLKEIIIAENDPFDTDEDKSRRLGEKAMAYMCHTLGDGDLVGVSMGTALQTITRVKRSCEEPIHCTFVPILGGLCRDDMSNVGIHANQIAVKLAEIFGGSCIQFFSPAIFSEVSVLQGFLKEMPIRSIFKYYSGLSMVLVGIGEPSAVGSTLVMTQYINENALEEIVSDGAVGDVCLRFYDKDGNMEPFHRFNDRVASIDPEEFKQVKRRVAVANGVRKAEAVLGAIRGGFINVLVTDMECAQRMLEILDERSPQ
ncbi:MAG: sugar-binding transcriptional regulator [Lachnospiraceae bacterium]|nr:sugar-binding transcriptional regulator [Lachnospiraceae bacterium]